MSTINREDAITEIEKAMCEDGFRSGTGLVHKTTVYEILRSLPETQPKFEDASQYVPKTFIVIDTTTGKEADPYEIALHEDWANDLMYCDMEGFAILEDGSLILTDECGQFKYCPEGRFEVRWE